MILKTASFLVVLSVLHPSASSPPQVCPCLAQEGLGEPGRVANRAWQWIRLQGQLALSLSPLSEAL